MQHHMEKILLAKKNWRSLTPIIFKLFFRQTTRHQFSIESLLTAEPLELEQMILSNCLIAKKYMITQIEALPFMIATHKKASLLMLFIFVIF